MPKNKDFTRRIELIDACLRNNLRKWTLKTLLETINEKLEEGCGAAVSKRTLQGDIQYMELEKNAPIVRQRESNKVYFSYDTPDYSIKNLPIKEEEVNLLNDAINILRQVNDFKILPEVDAIINKLQNTVQANVTGNAAIIQFEKHTTALGMEYIDDIFTAIKQKVSLRVTYQSYKAKEPTEYVFHPYLLKEWRNRWFVLGRQNENGYLTICALDRIKKIKNSASPYILNDLFDPDTYFNNLIGVTMPANANIEMVEIKVAPGQVPYIKSKPIHHTQEIVKEDGYGYLLITLKVVDNYELRSVLLGFGADIEVVKPLSLREGIQELFNKGIELYM
ncbi:YafY family protein [Chitinophaga sp. HK235]|uniref:helix-turn-helix transcriptional regulator n=1 Tax=Chitinophaga sp. HK235 TaxID=2952571 RepID=UPI001BA9947F|nr:WYL domain-containing protein [Chitinophaga sp. HK235]